MKNDFQRLLPLCSLAFVVCALIIFGEPQEKKSHAEGPAKDVLRSRRPAQIKKTSPKNINRSPSSVAPVDFSKLVVPDREVKLSPALVVAKNIAAMPKSNWKIGMKPFLWENGSYGFYEKAPGEKGGVPVSYNSRNNKFYIISSILHIRGVDQETRNDLLSQGHQEYYYFKKIKFLSLRSSSDEVIKLYGDLKKQGYAVSLEVLKERPVAQ